MRAHVRRNMAAMNSLYHFFLLLLFSRSISRSQITSQLEQDQFRDQEPAAWNQRDPRRQYIQCIRLFLSLSLTMILFCFVLNFVIWASLFSKHLFTLTIVYLPPWLVFIHQVKGRQQCFVVFLLVSFGFSIAA